MRTIVLPSPTELLELGRGGVVKVVCYHRHITLVLATSSPGDAPAAAGVGIAPAAELAAPMKEVAAAAGSGAGRRLRGQRHRRRRREARAALLLQRLARGGVARLRVARLRGSRDEQVFGPLGSEPEQPAHAVERPAVLVLATSTAWEARRQEVAASAVEVEACAAPAAAMGRPDAWSASGEIQVAARRWLARRCVARLRAAVPQQPPPLESGAGAPSAAEAKRRVDFSAPVPPSKRAWVETGIGAGWLREMARAAAPAAAAAAAPAAAAAAPPPAPVVVVMEVPATATAPKRKVSFGAEVSPAKAVAGLQGEDGHDDYSEAEEESVYSEEELSGSEAAEDEWWAQGGGRGGCLGGDFGDDAATIARAAQWQRDNPELAERQAEFFHSLGLDPGGAVAKEELLALELSPDYRHECGICDRDYMLRRGCPCCRD